MTNAHMLCLQECSIIIFCCNSQAFDTLEQLKIVCPAEGSESGVGKSMREFRMMELNVVEDQVKEAVKTYPNCPTDVIRWAGNRGGVLIGV